MTFDEMQELNPSCAEALLKEHDGSRTAAAAHWSRLQRELIAEAQEEGRLKEHKRVCAHLRMARLCGLSDKAGAIFDEAIDSGATVDEYADRYMEAAAPRHYRADLVSRALAGAGQEGPGQCG